MQRKVCPEHCQSVFLFQSFDTPGDEVAPRSNEIAEYFRDFARSRGWSTTEAALAWILDQGEHLIPIPGTRSAAHLKEWAGVAEIKLTDEDRTEIERILPVGFAHGDRYSDKQIVGIERYC